MGIGHWTLLVVAWPLAGKAKIHFFDSLGGRLTARHQQAIRALANFLWLHTDAQDATVLPGAETPVTHIMSVVQGPLECGVWVMAIARALLCGEDNVLPNRRQIPGLRLLLASECLIGHRLARNIRPTYLPNDGGCIFGIPALDEPRAYTPGNTPPSQLGALVIPEDPEGAIDEMFDHFRIVQLTLKGAYSKHAVHVCMVLSHAKCA